MQAQADNMITNADFDRVWALFEETGRQIKDTDRILSAKFIETDEEIKGLKQVVQEINRTLSEKLERSNRELSERLEKNNQRLTERLEKTNKELTERLKETDRILSEKFKATQIMVGRLSNSWREFVEGLVYPSVTAMFNARNIEIEDASLRRKSRKGGETMEIDILGENGSYVVAVEVKSTLTTDHVIKYAEKLNRFKYFFPRHAEKKVIGAMAGINVDESVKNFAEKQGFFVIMQKGDIVDIVNKKSFKPKEW